MRDNNTHSRCSLSGDGVVLAVDAQVFDQPYLTRDGKTYRQRFVRKLLHRPTQRTFGGTVRIVRQRRHINDLAATTAGCVLTETFRAGESEQRIRQNGCESDY